jgi:transcriptional regulator with XRE-family HTH domain
MANQIKIALATNDMTQHDLALFLGVSDAYICNVLAGKKRFTDANKVKIAQRLGRSVGELFFGEGDWACVPEP